MTPLFTLSMMAELVETQPEAFDYVHRLELERALFSIAKEFASEELGTNISGFSDQVLQELQARSVDLTAAAKVVTVLIRILRRIQLISSGDPYITLEGEDIVLEGRREVIVSLGSDLRTLLAEFV